MNDTGTTTAGQCAKTARDENFPVASLLIARALRPHVMAFYAFARAADDIADAPALDAAEKLRRLDAFEAGLAGREGPACAQALRESLAARGLSDRPARTLLEAFREDATVRRRADWAALMAYCARSAHPVGRQLLALHGEREDASPGAHAASDALCAALQVLNHLQDLKDDYLRLDRVYLPDDWLAAEGLEPAALAGHRLTPALRRVLDRALDGCDDLLARAAALPGTLASRRLAGQSACILSLALRLARRLRRQDPLAGRVALSASDFAAAAALGLATALRATGGRRGAVVARPA